MFYPVLPSSDLGRQPRKVALQGHDLVLFRGEDDAAAAMDDACPHKGASLSEGSVREGRLLCPWHQWAFNSRGECTWPGTMLSHRLPCLGVREWHGILWLSLSGEDFEVPLVDGGFHAEWVEEIDLSGWKESGVDLWIREERREDSVLSLRCYRLEVDRHCLVGFSNLAWATGALPSIAHFCSGA
jgi:phenylpropionate dioxygenase-like ring-hydroxylating dioxygenase large terminal subunit